VFGAIAFAALLYSARFRDDHFLLPAGAAIFIAAFTTLAVSLLPFSLTIQQTAAPESALRFLFRGAGLFIFPLTIAYTKAAYFVFRGGVRDGA
jgi:cytochrome bd ubiquinol oxidase subunit II